MTDKKSDTSKDDRAPTQSPVLTTPQDKRVPPPETPDTAKAKSGKGSRSVLAPAALVVALGALGLSGVVWQQTKQAQESQEGLSAQLAGSVSAADRSASQIQDVQARVQQQDKRIAALQTQLGEAGNVIRDLDEALRSMTDRGSELVLLNDVDHLATIAQQQLQLGGNVRNAIVALESAQAQLARASRPALASLLQTLNGDLDRLRAASTIDVGAFSQQLEELAILLNEAPLIMPEKAERPTPEPGVTREQPAPTVPPVASEDGKWWEQAWGTTRQWSLDAWGSLREDLGQFIEVRRVDDASAMLMSPDQAARFRDNLRTRVMTAQLALMMRQPEIWKSETEAVVKAIESRYDETSPLTRKALRMARNMADASIDARLPTVDNTLHALASLREEQSRSFGAAEHPSGNTTPVEHESQAESPAATEPQEADPAQEAAASEPEPEAAAPEQAESVAPATQDSPVGQSGAETPAEPQAEPAQAGEQVGS